MSTDTFNFKDYSAEEGAARDKTPGDPRCAWKLWRKKALGK
jgi:hypothetical protein